MEFEILRPFGPSIVKMKIPNEIIVAMNRYTDEIVEDEMKSNILDHGSKLVGNVHQEILLDTDFMKKIKWAEFLSSFVSRWVNEELKKKIKHFQLIESWIVRQFQNDYNPVH